LWEQILKNKQITRFHKKTPSFQRGFLILY